MTPLVDIGANLAHKSFREDLAAVLARARAASVGRVVVTGTSTGASRRAWELARAHRGVLFSTAGVHPHEASRWGRDAELAVRELLREPEVVAVGECGLDYDRDFSPRPAQRQAFAAQLAIAADTGKPVFLHERAAHDDFLSIVREHRVRGVVHCFTGEARELDAYLRHGLFIGMTGFVADERRGTHLPPLLPRVPRDRLMIETDAPFLTPRTRRGRNEPAFLRDVLAAVARAVSRSEDSRCLADRQRPLRTMR
ncbi:MAG: TatD family hydrolase [Deltaproteobacteria bacterium]|nr:TatD family hydrolase [Deltaproteobacteria bacterium]